MSDAPPTPTTLDAAITLLVWDAADALARLLQSLERGIARRATWRMYILDQGSDARTRAMLEAFANGRPRDIEIDRVATNIGYPAGHNRLHRLAARRARSRYLVTINSDLEFTQSDWLDQLVTFCDARPDAGIAGPGAVRYQREPIDRLGWCRVATSDEAARGQYDAISGAVCIIRQSMIDDIGLFDEAFTPGYYEDTDLSFRARACGWRLAICPLGHIHRPLGDAASTSQQKHDELTAQYGNFQKRNRNLFVERWLGSDPPRLVPSQLRAMFPHVHFPEAAATPCLASAS